VSGRFAGRWIERVLSSPDQLDHGQGEVGELLRVSLASPGEEGLEGRRIRFVGQPVSETRRELRDPVPAFRGWKDSAEGRKFLRSEAGRGTPFAVTVKSSINCFARFLRSSSRSERFSPLKISTMKRTGVLGITVAELCAQFRLAQAADQAGAEMDPLRAADQTAH